MGDDRLTVLYRQYGPYIYARCKRLLGDRAAAEDATQETFVRVHRHLDKVRDPQEALAWIYRIATNYCLNQIRDRKLHLERDPELPVPLDDAEAVLAHRDLIGQIIRRCPTKARMPAWLHYVDGLDQGEVAQVLGLSRRTVVARLAEFKLYARKFHPGSLAS
jgi:RNA polymerase sigma-70 factor (ECF subfamily)